METVEVRSLHVFHEGKYLIADLASFEWKPRLGTNAELRRGAISLLVRQAGLGNHQGVPVLKLVPAGKWEDAEGIVKQLVEPSGETVPLTLSVSLGGHPKPAINGHLKTGHQK